MSATDLSALRIILFFSGIFGSFLIVVAFGHSGLNWPDMLLLLWGVLFVSLAPFFLYLVRRQRALNQTAKNANMDARQAFSFSSPFVRYNFYLALILVAPIFIVLLEIRNWTPALHLNFQVLPI